MTDFRKAGFTTAVMALAIVLATPLLAEQNIVTGSIVDGAGKPIAGYPVVIENAETQAKGYSDIVGVTAADGKFSVVIDTPGTYSVVLPTQGDARLPFEVKERQKSRGFLGLGSAVMINEQLDLGNIQLK